MHKQHPLAKHKLTMENYAKAMHIMVAPLGNERGYMDEQLSLQGLQRQVRLSVPDFSQLETHLLHGEHIVTLPHRVAINMAEKDELVIKQLPFEVPSFDYYLFWHRRFSNENSNRWMRELVIDLLSESR